VKHILIQVDGVTQAEEDALAQAVISQLRYFRKTRRLIAYTSDPCIFTALDRSTIGITATTRLGARPWTSDQVSPPRCPRGDTYGEDLPDMPTTPRDVARSRQTRTPYQADVQRVSHREATR